MNRYALVVDNSALMRGLIVSTLSHVAELKPVEACGVFEGFEILPQKNFDISLTDFH